MWVRAALFRAVKSLGRSAPRLLERLDGFVEFAGGVPVVAFIGQQLKRLSQWSGQELVEDRVGILVALGDDVGQGFLFLRAALLQEAGGGENVWRIFGFSRINALLLEDLRSQRESVPGPCRESRAFGSPDRA